MLINKTWDWKKNNNPQMKPKDKLLKMNSWKLQLKIHENYNLHP